MRIAPLLLVAALVAGCATTPTDTAPDTAEGPQFRVLVQDVNSSFYVQDPGVCPGPFCGATAATYEVARMATKGNVTAMSLNVTSNAGRNAAVNVTLECRTTLGLCWPSMTYSGQLPTTFAYNASHIAAPMALVMSATWVEPPAVPFSSSQQIRVEGWMAVNELILPETPDQPRPDTVLTNETLPILFDGHSGPCNFVEPNCSSWPGGTRAEFPIADDAIMTSVIVNATWTSTTPLDQELTFYVDCWVDFFSPCSDFPSREVTGASPLSIRLDDLEQGGGTLIIEGQNAPVAGVSSLAGTRTPYHLEGSIELLVPMTA